MGVMWQDFSDRVNRLAVAFCTSCKRSRDDLLKQLKSELQESSLDEMKVQTASSSSECETVDLSLAVFLR